MPTAYIYRATSRLYRSAKLTDVCFARASTILSREPLTLAKR